MWYPDEKAAEEVEKIISELEAEIQMHENEISKLQKRIEALTQADYTQSKLFAV